MTATLIQQIKIQVVVLKFKPKDTMVIVSHVVMTSVGIILNSVQ